MNGGLSLNKHPANDKDMKALQSVQAETNFQPPSQVALANEAVFARFD